MIDWIKIKEKFIAECTNSSNSTVEPTLTKTPIELFDWMRNEIEPGKQMAVSTKTGIVYRIHVKESKITEAYQECRWMVGREFSDINKWFGMKESDVLEI